MRAGPLAGVRIVEIAGIGPAPYAAMLLADLGADILRIERKEGVAITRQIGIDATRDSSNRGRPSIAVDMKHPDGAALVLDLASDAAALIEGFRPGVMERLGLGPDVCLARNPRLVYGRMTGWGQTGPLATTAGHDINYIALSGMLHTFARAGERPLPPGNTVGDMGGGGLMLAFGIVCGLYEAKSSGRGQVVDAAMFEGAASLGTSLFVMMGMGLHDANLPGTNLSDTGAHFYEVYETKDRRHVAVGAIEPQFYAELLRGLELDALSLPAQMDRRAWPEMKRRFAELFRARTRDEWDRGLCGKGCMRFTGAGAFRGRAAPTRHRAWQLLRAGRGAAAGPGSALQPNPRRDRVRACYCRPERGPGAACLGRQCPARRRSPSRRRPVVNA